MRFASISFALMLTPAISFAQSSGWLPPVPSAARIPPRMAARLPYMTGNCPVGLRARRQGTVSMVTVDGTLRREVVPSVRLMIDNLQWKDIAGATVTVRGYDAN